MSGTVTPTQAEADSFEANSHGGTAPPVNLAAPVVTGDPVVGGELIASPGDWTQAPSVFNGQWLSDGTTSVGQGLSYTIQASDSGHAITCVVVASSAYGSTASSVSNSISVS
jgi:hypothetical protein